MSNIDKLIVNNMSLAKYIAKKCWSKCSKYHELEDLVSVAYCSLVKSAKLFDESKGKFSTFAYRCIQNDVIKYIKTNSRGNDIMSLNDIVANKDDSETERIEFIEGEIDDPTIADVRMFIEKIVKNEWGKTKKGSKYIERNIELLSYIYLYGYRQVDVAPMYGLTRQNIKLIVDKFNENAKKYLK